MSEHQTKRDPAPRILRFMAEVGRPISAGEISSYAGISGVRFAATAAERDEALRRLLAEGLVQTGLKDEPYSHGSEVRVTRRYYWLSPEGVARGKS